MATELKIARGFALPLDIVTEAVGIVATRGAGKSFASAVLIEEAIGAKVQTVVLDVMGVYHGLRSSAAGDGNGLPIYVLGGQHGDLPLEPSAGAFIADLVVDSGHSFVLDLSDFSKAKARTFVADFLERLYERKARSKSTLLLVVDEADEFAPQKPRGDAIRALGAMETVAKRGRSRGIGIVLITQRTQALNKDVLDLIETLLAMRQLAERSREAVKGWIADRELRDELGVIESLPSLPTGTAWVWSPVRGILQKVQIRATKTFDSYRTPKPGEAAEQPTARAELDLTALGEQMRATVERAQENNPALLRRRITDLQRELAARPAETREVPIEKIVEVSVFTPEDWERLDALFGSLPEKAKSLATYAARIELELREFASKLLAANADMGRWAVARREQDEDARSRTLGAGRPSASRPAPAAHPVENRNGLDTGARRLLETLGRHHPMWLSGGQLAVLAGRKARGGAWNTAMKQLRDGGYVTDEGGLLALTDHGIAESGADDLVPITTEEIIDRWQRALPTGPRGLFDLLVKVYPNPVSPLDAATQLGRQPRGGAWNTSVSTLVRNGLAEKVAGELRASDSLFITEGAIA